MSDPQIRCYDRQPKILAPGEMANRDASRVRMRAMREKRKIEAEAAETVRVSVMATRARHWRAVWTPEEVVQIKACMARGMTRQQIVAAIPSKTLKQVDTKIQSMSQSSKHTDGLTPHGGGGMKPVSKPSVVQIAQRDAVLNADYAQMVHLDPNISLLGDPSPASRAMLDQRNAERVAAAARRRPTLGMSAVPVTRLGDTNDLFQINRIMARREATA